jgi:hypothetical protein
VVSCREDMPAQFTDHSGCEEIGGIGWFTSDAELKDPTIDAKVYSVGVEPIVTVALPASYRADAAGVLTEIAAAVRSELALDRPCV